MFWIPEEIDLYKDIEDWNNLSIQERKMLKFILGFFSFSDGVVNENIVNSFYLEV
jgi:ribonucleotide reductase beta subunit family protein with ferritin-like domain